MTDDRYVHNERTEEEGIRRGQEESELRRGHGERELRRGKEERKIGGVGQLT